MARSRTLNGKPETILLAVLLSLACCLALAPAALAEGDAVGPSDDALQVVTQENSDDEGSIEVVGAEADEGANAGAGSEGDGIEDAGAAELADDVSLSAQASNIATGTWGTCPWKIDADGTLTVYPGTGASTIFFSEGDGERFISPWARWASSVKRARFVAEGNERVVASAYCPYLFAGFDNMTEVDFSGLYAPGEVGYAEFMFGPARLDTFIAGESYVVTSSEMVPRSSAADGKWYSASEGKWLTREEIFQRGTMSGVYGSSPENAIDPNGPTDPANPFIDVTESTPHYEDILWLAETGISTGWDTPAGREYRPFANVARCDMAAFLFRLAKMWGALGASDSWAPKAATMAKFKDVTSKTPHAQAVWWLAENGISEGWNAGGGKKEFRPYANIARSDFAAFIGRLCHRAARNGVTDVDRQAFLDVSERVAHANEIWWMAANEISKGWGTPAGKEFRPLETVKRCDMAAFLHRVKADVDEAYQVLLDRFEQVSARKATADQEAATAAAALRQAQGNEATKRSAYEQADAAAKAARQAEAKADEERARADTALRSAGNALDAAASDLSNAQRNANAAAQDKQTADANVVAAESTLATKNQALAAAQAELEAAQAAHAQVLSGGSVAFFNAQGNTRAAGYLTDQSVMESNGTTFASHTTIGGKYDATNLENMLMALDWLDYCNQIRQQLAQELGVTLQPYRVTDELMASAQRNANFSTHVYRHALTPSGYLAMADNTGSGWVAENLYFTLIGKQEAYDGWLWDEKQTWERLVRENPALRQYWLDYNGLSSYYASIGKSTPNVGHYFALADPTYLYTGLGLNTSTSAVGGQGAAIQQFRQHTTATTYTVAEYRQRLEAYYNVLTSETASRVSSATEGVNAAQTAAEQAASTLSSMKAAAAQAQSVLNNANAQLQATQAAKNTAQATYDAAKAKADAAQSTWQAAHDDAVAKEQTAEQAAQALASAEQATASAKQEASAKQAAATAAARELAAAQRDLDNYVA